MKAGQPSQTGTISFEVGEYAKDISGMYNLRVNTFDENDGAATIKVQVTGEDDVTINLDENTNSPFPTDDTFRSYIIKDLELDGSETITITGTSDDSIPNDGADRGGEFARIDFLTFEPVDM